MADATRLGVEEEDTGERPGLKPKPELALELDVVYCELGTDDDIPRLGTVDGLVGIFTGARDVARLAFPWSVLDGTPLSGPDSLSSLICVSASAFSSTTAGTTPKSLVSFHLNFPMVWLSAEGGPAPPPRIDDVCESEKSHESSLYSACGDADWGTRRRSWRAVRGGRSSDGDRLVTD
jgi:hypothetical protein